MIESQNVFALPEPYNRKKLDGSFPWKKWTVTMLQSFGWMLLGLLIAWWGESFPAIHDSTKYSFVSILGLFIAVFGAMLATSSVREGFALKRSRAQQAHDDYMYGVILPLIRDIPGLEDVSVGPVINITYAGSSKWYEKPKGTLSKQDNYWNLHQFSLDENFLYHTVGAVDMDSNVITS